MRPFLSGCMTLSLALVPTLAAVAAPVNFSGTVTYSGTHTADSLYAAVVDTTGPTTLGYQALPAGTPPLSIPYSIAFDNAGLTMPVLMAAVLDVDGTGFDADSLDATLTNADIIGWYPGQPDPTFLDASTSLTGLDFALPTAEIQGDVIFAAGQMWADIEALSIPNEWSPATVKLSAAGPYAIVVYAGSWYVYGGGPFGDVCHGDATCVSPTVLTLTAGETRTGIDVDFTPTPVVPVSWGGIKRLYR